MGPMLEIALLECLTTRKVSPTAETLGAEKAEETAARPLLAVETIEDAVARGTRATGAMAAGGLALDVTEPGAQESVKETGMQATTGTVVKEMADALAWGGMVKEVNPLRAAVRTAAVVPPAASTARGVAAKGRAAVAKGWAASAARCSAARGSRRGRSLRPIHSRGAPRACRGNPTGRTRRAGARDRRSPRSCAYSRRQ
mmetsp:Transcript_34949/g.86972  ORF Transcript_34949/g.86972 Transcript_34949/m.86972 type:complete len:200 (+) Transcript_34949:148-747(+)